MSLQTIVTGRVVPPADVLLSATGKERPTLLSLREQTAPGDHTSRWLGRINHAYYDRRSRARADHGYSLRRLDSPTLITNAEALGLRLVERRNYSLSVPGLRRLPNTLQFRLERGFLNSRLSRHGGESVADIKLPDNTPSPDLKKRRESAPFPSL